MTLIKPIAYWEQKRVQTPTPPAVQNLYICGYNFYQWNGTRLGLNTQGGIAKIGLDGILDTTFATNANPVNTTQARFFSPLNGNFYVDYRIPNTSTRTFSKLDAAGNIINTVGTGTGGSIWAVNALEGSNFIIISGDASINFNGTLFNNIAKIDENLNLDTTFTTNIGTGPTGGAPNGYVQQTRITSDKIAVVGRFTSFNGYANSDRFIVLNHDGTRDTNFNRVGSFFGGSSIVYDALWIANKWIVVGTFISYAGNTSVLRIAAFNPDGSLDTTFTTNMGTGPNSNVWKVQKLNDTQMLISGQFGTINGNIRNRIAVINVDGTLAPNINGTGFTSGTQALVSAVDASNKLYFSSTNTGFTTYNGIAANNIFSINADGSTNSSFVYGTGMRTSGGTVGEAGGLYIR